MNRTLWGLTLLSVAALPAWSQQTAPPPASGAGDSFGYYVQPDRLAERPPITTIETRVLLLTNGSAVVGQIFPEGQSIMIALASGSQLRFDREDVDAIFETHRGALDYLRTRVPADDFEGHVRLFHWCLRYGLTDEAQRQIDRLQYMRISAVRLESLSRQLAMFRRQEVRQELAATDSGSSEDATTTPASPQAMPMTLTRQAGNATSTEVSAGEQVVKPVNFEQPLETPANYMVPGRDLDEFIKRLPAHTTSSYKRGIEPVILRSCSNAGCHHQASPQFALLELGRGVEIPQRMSQQNLYRILRLAGDGAPDRSPLLQAAATPHGGSDIPPLEPGSVPYEMLKNWIASLGDAHLVAGIEQLNPYSPSRDPGSIQLRSAPAERSASGTTAPAVNSAASPPGRDLPVIPRLEADSKTFVPRDPFDPEIFNRFYLNSKAPLPRAPAREPQREELPPPIDGSSNAP